MTSSTWAADRGAGGAGASRSARGFALAVAIAFVCALAAPSPAARADGEEWMDGESSELPLRGERTFSSTWRRPESCDVAPPLAVDRSGGGRTLVAAPEAASCRSAPPLDPSEWLGPIWVDVEAPRSHRRSHRAGRRAQP